MVDVGSSDCNSFLGEEDEGCVVGKERQVELKRDKVSLCIIGTIS
jgi:hypothetical protein